MLRSPPWLMAQTTSPTRKLSFTKMRNILPTVESVLKGDIGDLALVLGLRVYGLG